MNQRSKWKPVKVKAECFTTNVIDPIDPKKSGFERIRLADEETVFFRFMPRRWIEHSPCAIRQTSARVPKLRRSAVTWSWSGTIESGQKLQNLDGGGPASLLRTSFMLTAITAFSTLTGKFFLTYYLRVKVPNKCTYSKSHSGSEPQKNLNGQFKSYNQEFMSLDSQVY